MSKKTLFPKSSYPSISKLWFVIALAINFIFGISFLYTQLLIIPYIALAIINIYGISLLTRENKQGFYTLCSSFLVFLIYTIITKKPSIFLTIAVINFIMLAITWLCVRRLWNHSR